MEDFLEFWGKASGAVEGEPNFHPVAYHNLDVAAAAAALLHANARHLIHMSQWLGTSPDNARRVIVALMALHDIGKFSETFQFKVPERWPEQLLGPPRFEPDSHHRIGPCPHRHGKGGAPDRMKLRTLM